MTDDKSWRTPVLVSYVIRKLDKEKQRSRNVIRKHSWAIEQFINHISKSKEEYISILARLLIRIRNYHLLYSPETHPECVQRIFEWGRKCEDDRQPEEIRLKSKLYKLIDKTKKAYWRQPIYRKNVVRKIEIAKNRAAMKNSRSCQEMERKIFNKASSPLEYFCLVSRLINYFRDMAARKIVILHAQSGSHYYQGFESISVKNLKEYTLRIVV